MNVLIVKYLPSGDQSNTQKLVNHLKYKVHKHQIEELDLIKTPALAHNLETMQAYKTRNFRGQSLSKDLAEAISPMDKMASQLKKADFVILVTPMHNFSLPGPVKTYFDSVMQSGINLSSIKILKLRMR